MVHAKTPWNQGGNGLRSKQSPFPGRARGGRRRRHASSGGSDTGRGSAVSARGERGVAPVLLAGPACLRGPRKKGKGSGLPLWEGEMGRWGALGYTGKTSPSGPEFGRGRKKRKKKISFLFLVHNFKSKFKSNLISFEILIKPNHHKMNMQQHVCTNK